MFFLLRDPQILENAKFYAQARGKTFDNNVDLIKFFQEEKKQPGFAENMQKAMKLKFESKQSQGQGGR